MKAIIWSIKDIVDILKARQQNEFDGNICISGDRGNGKSTLLTKIFYRFDNFDPWKHQVYNKEDIITLLKEGKYGLCFDDEAINSGYKRNWQDKGQQELIKILTAFRDSFNIYGSAIPNFFSLDKDLRDLYFLVIQVIERGVGVVHMPLQGRMYSQDRWDAKNNAKIEEKWSAKQIKNPHFKIPYHQLSTFRGYIYFDDLPKAQKELYKEVKKVKRAEAFLTEKEKADDEKKNEKPFIEKVYEQLIERKLTREGLIQICQINGQKYTSLVTNLNRMLQDSGKLERAKDLLLDSKTKIIHNKISDELNNLIPEV